MVALNLEGHAVVDGQLIHSPMTSPSNFDHANARCFSSIWRGLGWLASDALITTDSSIMISVRTADCLPIFIEGGGEIIFLSFMRVGEGRSWGLS